MDSRIAKQRKSRHHLDPGYDPDLGVVKSHRPAMPLWSRRVRRTERCEPRWHWYRPTLERLRYRSRHSCQRTDSLLGIMERASQLLLLERNLSPNGAHG